MMRGTTLIRVFAILVVMVSAPPIAPAQEAPPRGLSERDVGSIRRAITDQIDAFKRDDAMAAYGLAAPGIKKAFPSAEAFMTMVRRSYRPVYRPRHYAFEPLVEIDRTLVQPVAIIGPDGLPVTAHYVMERQPDGAWRIGGCVLTQVPGRRT